MVHFLETSFTLVWIRRRKWRPRPKPAQGTSFELKLVGDDVDLARVEAVREAAPSASAHRRQRVMVAFALSKHCSGVEETNG